MLREQALLQELEATTAKLVEWRGVAHKLKEEISGWSEECERLKLVTHEQQQDIARWSEECERLKSAAQKAQASGPTPKRPSGSGAELFKKLRALLSKGLHPDYARDPTEKLIRTKIFQELWPQINDLESRA